MNRMAIINASVRFGMMIQKNANGVRPVALTPIMAGYESRMFKGDTYRFTIRYVLRPGEWQDTYKYIAKKIYDFREICIFDKLSDIVTLFSEPTR